MYNTISMASANGDCTVAAAKNGYANASTTVTISGTDITNADITLKSKYSITNNLTNITNSNTSTYRLMTDETPYETTPTADIGYTFPASIIITVGGSLIHDNAGYYFYSQEVGILNIPDWEITGDLEITAAGVSTYTHSWATEWTTNATHHWHECVGAGTCDIIDDSATFGYGAHTAGDWLIDTNATASIRKVQLAAM